MNVKCVYPVIGNKTVCWHQEEKFKSKFFSKIQRYKMLGAPAKTGTFFLCADASADTHKMICFPHQLVCAPEAAWHDSGKRMVDYNLEEVVDAFPEGNLVLKSQARRSEPLEGVYSFVPVLLLVRSCVFVYSTVPVCYVMDGQPRTLLWRHTDSNGKLIETIRQTYNDEGAPRDAR
jgi:hypothetical protein